MVPKLLSRSSRTTIAIGLLVPILLVGIPALLAFRVERQLKHAFEMVTHTLAVERAVQSLASSIVDAETGQRGFLLTRREIYLQPYEAGRARVGQQVNDLRLLTADNPDQQQRLDELQPLIRERLALLDETVALGRRGEFDAALEMVNSDRGRERMEKIRGILRVMDEDERRLLWMRQREASKQASRNTLLIMGLLVAAVGCAGVVFYLLRRLSETEPVVNMCAYSRTIEYEGEWISFEEYLRRRFNVTTSHGMSPAEFERVRAAIRR
jgi:methyl-accepting chemotaxis protein